MPLSPADIAINLVTNSICQIIRWFLVVTKANIKTEGSQSVLCLPSECIGFDTGLHSPSSACAASYRAYTCCTHRPATCLAQPLGPAHGWGHMHTDRSSSHTPFSFFGWAWGTRQFASMLLTSFHPKECCLSWHLDKDSCPLNIQGGATYKAFILLFPIAASLHLLLQKTVIAARHLADKAVAQNKLFFPRYGHRCYQQLK